MEHGRIVEDGTPGRRSSAAPASSRSCTRPGRRRSSDRCLTPRPAPLAEARTCRRAQVRASTAAVGLGAATGGLVGNIEGMDPLIRRLVVGGARRRGRRDGRGARDAAPPAGAVAASPMTPRAATCSRARTDRGPRSAAAVKVARGRPRPHRRAARRAARRRPSRSPRAPPDACATASVDHRAAVAEVRATAGRACAPPARRSLRASAPRPLERLRAAARRRRRTKWMQLRDGCRADRSPYPAHDRRARGRRPPPICAPPAHAGGEPPRAGHRRSRALTDFAGLPRRRRRPRARLRCSPSARRAVQAGDGPACARLARRRAGAHRPLRLRPLDRAAGAPPRPRSPPGARAAGRATGAADATTAPDPGPGSRRPLRPDRASRGSAPGTSARSPSPCARRVSKSTRTTAEPLGVPVPPLEVVQQRPHEVAAQVHAPRDGARCAAAKCRRR